MKSLDALIQSTVRPVSQYEFEVDLTILVSKDTDSKDSIEVAQAFIDNQKRFKANAAVDFRNGYYHIIVFYYPELGKRRFDFAIIGSYGDCPDIVRRSIKTQLEFQDGPFFTDILMAIKEKDEQVCQTNLSE